MLQRLPVQFLTVVLPEGHEAVHVGDEAVVVMSLEQVDHFVDDDVFEAVGGFFDEFEVEPDAAGSDVAGAPFCFHLFDAPG